MREKKEKKPMTWKRVFHGIFNWQTLLVASAFMGFFVFAGYICGNISAPYRIPDTQSAEYAASEQGFLIFFIVGSVVSLFIALFAAYMCDHPDFFKKLLRKNAPPSEKSANDGAEDSLRYNVAVSLSGGENDDAVDADRRAPDFPTEPN